MSYSISSGCNVIFVALLAAQAPGCGGSDSSFPDGAPGDGAAAAVLDGAVLDGAAVDAVLDAEAPADASPLPVFSPRLAAGWTHTCVVSAGAVRCFGYAAYGQLGYGNTINIGDDELPASAGDVDVGGTVVQVVTGSLHTCALLDTGAVRCWGDGGSGKLGYGNENDIGDDETPASAGDVDVGGTVVQLAAGESHTCALLDTGAVRCWGSGFAGQLGYPELAHIGDDETPATAGDVPVGGPVVQVTAGYWHTCALFESGFVRCWGANLFGQCGYGTDTGLSSPTEHGNVNVGGTVRQISASDEHTCALLDTRAVRCWGRGLSGRLGYGSTEHIGDDENPASAGDIDLGGTAVLVSAGSEHTCAILDGGAVRCWGLGMDGALGYGNNETIGDNETPASAGDVILGGAAEFVDTGESSTCALLTTGGVRCWGYGGSGRLGYGNTNQIGDNETPASAGDVPVF